MSTTDTAHLVIVDDDAGIRNSLKKFFTPYGFRISTANGGDSLLTLLEKEKVDLIILDIMMPGSDGFDICRRIRVTMNIPIIMLTAMAEGTERIVGLEVGADDYLTKPFNPRELLARVKAVLRRVQNTTNVHGSIERHYHFSDWTLSKTTRYLTSPEGVKIDLTSGEFDLLMTFLTRPQRVLTRDQLMESTKGHLTEAYDRSIDIQISRLRHKIEVDPKNPAIIITVRNGGYMFSSPVTIE